MQQEVVAEKCIRNQNVQYSLVLVFKHDARPLVKKARSTKKSSKKGGLWVGAQPPSLALPSINLSGP